MRNRNFVKETRVILFVAFIICCIMYQVKVHDNTILDHQKIINDSIITLNTEASVIQQKLWDQSTINIILLNKMSERNHMKLLSDSVYLELATKIY